MRILVASPPSSSSQSLNSWYVTVSKQSPSSFKIISCVVFFPTQNFLLTSLLLGLVSQGMSLMTISASIGSLQPPQCAAPPCESATPSDLAVLYVGLYLIALGSGGLKPCLSSLGADQFDETHLKERRLSSVYFNWFFFSFVAGGLLGVTVLVYIQDNIGNAVGYGVCLALVAAGLAVFLAGTRRFRKRLPSGSPLTRILQVFVAAVRKMHRPVPPSPDFLFEMDDKEAAHLGFQKIDHTNYFRYHLSNVLPWSTGLPCCPDSPFILLLK